MKGLRIDTIMNNVEYVLTIINEINSNINVPSPNVVTYFLSGNCNIYAEILANIFDNFVEFYTTENNGHVVTKIGDYLYDAGGLIYPFEYVNYTLLPHDQFTYLSYTIWGVHNLENQEIIKQGTLIGKNKLNELLNNKSRIKNDRY